MADLILICQRAGRRRSPSGDDLLRVAARLAPTNIVARPARLLETKGLSLVVANPSPDGVRVRDDAVCLGGLFGEAGEWWRLGADAPDGTYALVRHSEAAVELLSDVIASRTLWYAIDDETFLASTSQRALVALLGGLELNRQAVSWLLSSGTLGPESSWDARLRRLPGCSRLTFDRTTWRAQVETRPIEFAPQARDRRTHVANLREALAWSCANLNIDVRQWVLPLSGGRDSRALLAFMVRSGCGRAASPGRRGPRSSRPLSDAFVARLVARRFGVEHEFVWLDGNDEEPTVALDRFVAVGEGRSDAVLRLHRRLPDLARPVRRRRQRRDPRRRVGRHQKAGSFAGGGARQQRRRHGVRLPVEPPHPPARPGGAGVARAPLPAARRRPRWVPRPHLRAEPPARRSGAAERSQGALPRGREPAALEESDRRRPRAPRRAAGLRTRLRPGGRRREPTHPLRALHLDTGRRRLPRRSRRGRGGRP